MKAIVSKKCDNLFGSECGDVIGVYIHLLADKPHFMKEKKTMQFWNELEVGAEMLKSKHEE